jgi:hypothetical protein
VTKTKYERHNSIKKNLWLHFFLSVQLPQTVPHEKRGYRFCKRCPTERLYNKVEATKTMDNYTSRVEGERISSLIDACEEKFLARRYTSNSGQTQILLFESYSFWRTNSNMALILTFDFEGANSCKLSITAAGGAAGVLQFDWGSEDSQLNKVRKIVEEYASVNALKMKQVDDEESGWTYKVSAPATLTPKSFLKKCAKCGREIPIASEECEFCGASQPKKSK